MNRLVPGTAYDVNVSALDHVPVDPTQQVEPLVTTGSEILQICFGIEVGLWEMSAGSMRDIEGDEIFVVVSGAGTLEFDSPSLPPIELRTGSVVRVTNGMRTRWTITEAPLRKIYITSSTTDGQSAMKPLLAAAIEPSSRFDGRNCNS